MSSIEKESYELMQRLIGKIRDGKSKVTIAQLHKNCKWMEGTEYSSLFHPSGDRNRKELRKDIKKWIRDEARKMKKWIKENPSPKSKKRDILKRQKEIGL